MRIRPRTLLRRPAPAQIASAALSLSLCYLLVGASPASELRRSAIVRAVQGARPSIVNIHGQKTVTASVDNFGNTESLRRVNGMGTGVVIDPRGYIVTNHHVVHGVRRIQVTMADGKTHVARVVSYDPRTDLAVIKIDADEDIPVIKLGTSADLMAGETVVAVGNAYGYENTVTRGIISALHRSVQVSETQHYEDLIQTDASINPGNSGGPLLNIDGEMIGLNVAVRAGAQGIGFAIPVNKVLDVAAELLSVNKVDDHWHGVVAASSADEHNGLVVEQIEADSPVAKGGLKPGDVITAVANHRVTRALDFERVLLGRQTGEEIEVVVRRDEQPVTLSFVLARSPRRAPSTQQRSWDRFGIRVNTVPAKTIRRMNPRYRGGLLVVDVRSDSPAAKQGIRSGDILVGMHIWETISLDNLSYILSRSDLDELAPLKFYILRGEETLYGHLSVAGVSGSRN